MTFVAQDDPYCGWLEVLPPPPPPNRLHGEQKADCVVIGGGFAGLAAARRLVELRPDWRVLLLESQRCGFGSSGRSSGFVVDLAGFIAGMPPETSERFIRLSRAGIDVLRQQIKRFGIDCGWDESGFMHAAATPLGEQSLRNLRSWLEKRGEAFVDLDARALQARLGTSFYRDAVLLPGSIQVEAGALAYGLARHLPESVELFEESAVRSIEPSEDGRHVLALDQGRVEAGRVIVTANAYSPSLGILRDRVFPLHTFGSLSAPLEDRQLEQLGTDRTWGILAQDPLGSSLRLLADRRLLVRNGLVYSPRFKISAKRLRQAQEEHRRALELRYPGLRNLEFPHTWAGAMGISPNHYPAFREVAPNLFATGGYTGAGIAMGTICGCLLAERAANETSTLLDDLQALPSPKWIPPNPFANLGIRIRVAWMNYRAGKQI